MKTLFATLLIVLTASTAHAERVANPLAKLVDASFNDAKCEMKETVGINVNFNRGVKDFNEAKNYVEQQRQLLEKTAADQGVKKFILNNFSYNISADSGNGEDMNYRVNGNFSYTLENSDVAMKLANALAEKKIKVNLNARGNRMGGAKCQENSND